MTDPLNRALSALTAVRSESLDPAAATAWTQAWDAVREAQGERETLLAVAREAQALVAILGKYEKALEQRDQDHIAVLAEAGAMAEERLAAALSQVRTDLEAKPQPWSEEAQLVALDHFADEDEDGPPPAT